MGKKTRRKGRHSNNKGNKNKAPYQDADNNNDDEATPSSSSSSALLQRIRHSDPRTRHAALAAVANTLLDTSTSSSRGVHPKVTPTLLAAIRERVMDADLDVCQVAAGCLANYVTIAAAAAATADSRKQQELQALSSGWTILLVGRLQQCYERVVVVAAEGNHPQPPKHQKQWLAVAVQCWRTLCVLVETNPAAVGRLTSALDATPRHDFHRTTLEWLQHGQSWWLSSRPVAATATVDNNSKALEDASRPFYEQILSLAARTLHSAWDDNAELLLPWKEECPDAFRRALELLQSMASPTSQLLPVDTQLHATGAILAARPFMGAQQQQQQQQQVILELTAHTVVPQLVQRLSSFSWDTVQSLLANYQAIVEVWEKEQADDALERDVIRKVEDRKEPARQIAKRQKAQKEANANANSASENNTADMKEEESKMEEDDLNKKVEEEIETQEALERARQKWNDFLLPLQLSLELLANVSSRAASSGDDEEEEDRMMMDDNDWGPEQEAQWMQDKQQEQERLQKQKAEDEVFQRVLVDSALPGQLVQLFRQVYQTPQASTTAISFPEQSHADLEDLQSKVMACLGNCWENISFWPLEVTWAELQQAAATATGVGKEGVVSAMVIALKTKPSLRKEWQPEHLTFWLQHVSSNSASSKGDTSNTMMSKDQSQQQQGNLSVRRDAITMLSVLCSQEPHPVEVNRQVCTTLLSALTNPSAPLMVQCEILNSLMDMYGNDEDDGCCYQSVFENLKVLGHFQRCIPALKSKLKEEERKVKQGAQGDHGADRLELEQWKETVLNSSRFVQYKKGQL